MGSGTGSGTGRSAQVEQGDRFGLSVRNWALGDLILIDARFSDRTDWLPEPGDGADVQLEIVKTGTVSIEERECKWRFGAGQMLLMDAAHPYRQTIGEGSHLIVIRIPRRCLRERGFEASLGEMIVPDLTLADVRAVRDLMLCFAEQNAATTAAVRRRQGNQLLDLFDVVVAGPAAPGRSRSKEATLFRTKQYIERHLRNTELSAATIASAVWASVVHLNRLFRAEGTSLMRYVRNRRLEVAAGLLLKTEHERPQIQEVAMRCGFSSHAHFSRVFRERYGMSPSDAIAAKGALPGSGHGRVDEL
jgi:AraC-like DNA-binding protein